jgi:hypothetical protein
VDFAVGLGAADADQSGGEAKAPPPQEIDGRHDKADDPDHGDDDAPETKMAIPILLARIQASSETIAALIRKP